MKVIPELCREKYHYPPVFYLPGLTMMTGPTSSRSSVFASLLFLVILPLSFALKFDLQAHPGHSGKYQRCIRNFVAKDQLVVVTATVGGSKGDGQVVNMHVSAAYFQQVLKLLIYGSRSRIHWITNMESPRMSWEKPGWLLHRMVTPPSMFASKTS